MEFVSQEYNQRLQSLASLLCSLNEVVTVNPLSIPRDEEFDIDYTYHPFQTIVEDTQIGFDQAGNFHHPRNRWDDMGTYMEQE